jgi:hypothetical protein
MHPTHSGEFKLSSGRSVYLSALNMSGTFEGALEGSPETLTRHLRERLAQSVHKILPPGMPLVIIGADVPVLPKYQWVARFFSRRGVNTDDPDYNSELTLCWFSEELYRDLPAAINEILLPLDWERLAGDYDMMP